MTDRPSRDFTKPWIILCEGLGDKFFFDNFMDARNITPRFDVWFAGREGERGGGRSDFGWWLNLRYIGNEAFRSNVKAILIISDNDSCMKKSFQEVQDSIKKAPGFPIPNAEREPAQANGFPTIVILMIPIDELGNLGVCRLTLHIM